MYINPDQYGAVFNEIKRTSSSHSTCKLVLFVSCLNIDSVCTARVLTLVFKKSLIQYQLIPVVGYADLRDHYQKLDPDVANVILIGCGAMIDLETFLEIDPELFYVEPQGTRQGLLGDLDAERMLLLRSYRRKIYVMDGNRPWNLDNVFGSEMIVCFDDGYIDQNLRSEKTSYKVLVDNPESELESDGDTDHDTDRETEEDGIEVNSDSETEKDGPVVDLSSGEKRKNEALDALEAKAAKRQRRSEIRKSEEVIEAYYNLGSALFTATSAIAYALLASIGETSIENLWLTIIGIASIDRQYPEVYDKLVPLLKEEVVRLSPFNRDNISTEKNADSNTLSVDKDYHLFLLRHWTLYDSFFYSSIVNSKLNLWREDGKKKLHKIFAKMGISLSVAQQKWLYMDVGIKRNLPVIFAKHLPIYGLEGIMRDGFIRSFGYMGQLSAMECVEALTALLEVNQQAFNEDGDTTQPGTDEINRQIELKEKLWIKNFWSSWDALNMTQYGSSSKIVTSNLKPNSVSIKKLKGFDLLMNGLDLAKSMQQVIFRTGMSVLERGLIKNLRLYRLCVLNDGAIPDLNMFKNPLILCKLGNWLLDTISEAELLSYLAKKESESKSHALKPLVLASLDISSDTYLVSGLAPRFPKDLDISTKSKLLKNSNGQTTDTTFTTRLNTFSVAFQKVAASSDAKTRINSFDSSIIEIRKDDLAPFLEKLTFSGLL
ncbi:hypothetical protein PUMCH_004627 [Australozyma saopauloensis]|uniref:Cell division control protein 45 n=1 Tax=Australozyma saopauloensis TaxID=291208 RepID=A0AAX4HF94_9ASCO|nr:hypothetical protein PUMCH_004627 [[Candida] saopauloensis]